MQNQGINGVEKHTPLRILYTDSLQKCELHHSARTIGLPALLNFQDCDDIPVQQKTLLRMLLEKALNVFTRQEMTPHISIYWPDEQMNDVLSIRWFSVLLPAQVELGTIVSSRL